MIKITEKDLKDIKIDSELHRKLKVIATLKNKTLKDEVEDLLIKGVDNQHE